MSKSYEESYEESYKEVIVFRDQLAREIRDKAAATQPPASEDGGDRVMTQSYEELIEYHEQLALDLEEACKMVPHRHFADVVRGLVAAAQPPDDGGECVIAYGANGHSGPGWYCWSADYAEDGTCGGAHKSLEDAVNSVMRAGMLVREIRFDGWSPPPTTADAVANLQVRVTALEERVIELGKASR